MYRFLFFTLILICLQSAFAQTDHEYGLLFSGNTVPPPQKTRLLLSSEGPLQLPDNFEISFDLAIWEVNHFGYILHLWNSSDESMILNYSHYPDSAKARLLFSANSIPTEETILLDKKELGPHKWHSVKIRFNTLLNTINIIYDDNPKKEIKSPAIFHEDLHILLGSRQGVNSDVPRMAIRNVQISTGNKPLYRWLLDNTSEPVSYDIIRDRPAITENSEWLKNRHLFWKKSKTLVIPETEFMYAYDQQTNRLILSSRKELWYYHLRTYSLKKISLTKPLGISGPVIYNNTNSKIVLNPGGYGQISFWDEQKKNFGQANVCSQYLEYCSGRFFYDVSTQTYFRVGGYGYYRVKNHVQRYNFQKSKWDTLSIIGINDFPPRTSPVVIKSSDQSDYYITGGHGNRDGRQESGFHPWLDLWNLDLVNMHLTLVSDRIDLPTGSYIQEGILNSVSQKINLLVSPENDLTSFQLFSLKRNDLSVQRVGNYLQSVGALRLLFYNTGANELYLLTRVKQNGKLKNKINLYSIAYPPLSIQTADSENKEKYHLADYLNKYLLVIVSILISACLIMLAMYIVRMRRRRISAPAIRADLARETADTDRQLPGIYVFGGFYIYDAEGNELTASMAPKTRQLLLYFLLNAYILGDKNSKGVTTEQLTRNLWPDLNQDNAKNARGTSMNRLRETLLKIPFLDINFQGHKWAIYVSDQVYYDYNFYKRFFPELKFQYNIVGNDKFQQLLRLTQNGPLLPNYNYDWLFPLQSAINNEIVEYYMNLLTKLDMSENIKMCEQIADTILKWETLNEEALAYKINLLNLQKRHDQAKNVYTKFARDYKEMFGEKYTK